MHSFFSLSMSVYKNDNPQHFKIAVESATIKQTLPPSEVVLVVDGPIPTATDLVIKELQEELNIPMKVIRLVKNVGHATARQTGLENVTYELVAIMDSDDIAVPTRFEMQLKAFKEHPEVAVIGGNIKEFVNEINNIVGCRIVPEKDEDIKVYLKSRCPLNLVTVMYKKSNVQNVGGFIDWYCEEDYYLWIRLALAGYKFYNVQENFVNVRVGEDMYQRRGGIKYFKSEAKLQKFMLDHKLISCFRYIYNVLIRFIVQVAMTNSLRGWFFQKIARK